MSRLSRLFLVLAFAAPLLHAQDDGPIKMTPDFPLAFPLVKVDRSVTVKFPVMILPTTVLLPGMVLRTIYMPPVPSENENLALAHKGSMEQAFSRSNSEDGQEKISPEIAHVLEGYRRTVWDIPNNFMLAMAQYPTYSMHIMYSPSGHEKDISDSRFSFFEGLFLGLPNGKVTVLAVENGSKSDQAGLKAGDEIVAVGNIPVAGDLTAFANAYTAARHDAKDSNSSSFSYTIHEPGQSGTRVVNLSMPPTIKSQLMDGF